MFCFETPNIHRQLTKVYRQLITICRLWFSNKIKWSFSNKLSPYNQLCRKMVRSTMKDHEKATASQVPMCLPSSLLFRHQYNQMKKTKKMCFHLVQSITCWIRLGKCNWDHPSHHFLRRLPETDLNSHFSKHHRCHPSHQFPKTISIHFWLICQFNQFWHISQQWQKTVLCYIWLKRYMHTYRQLSIQMSRKWQINICH